MNPEGFAATIAGKIACRLTQAAWFLMLVLLLAGGMVTSTGSGMAVPDWPTTFGEGMFAYDLLAAPRAVFIEHFHRLVGSCVGLMVFVAALLLWWGGARRSVRILGTGVFMAVVCQGILGGLRVVWNSPLLAMVHAVAAQGCFVLLSVLAATLSPRWRDRPEEGQRTARQIGTVSNLSLFLTVSIAMQLFFGVVLRHTGYGLGWHLIGAAAVTYAAFLLWGALRRLPEGVLGSWRTPAYQAVLLTASQVLLGVLSWMALYGEVWGAGMKRPGVSEAVTTLHLAIGALLFARSATLTAWGWSRMPLFPMQKAVQMTGKTA